MPRTRRVRYDCPMHLRSLALFAAPAVVAPLRLPLLALVFIALTACAVDDKALGESCGGDGECTSRLCYRGLCVPPPAEATKNGDPCTSPAFCQSFLCAKNRCEPGSAAMDAPCRHGAECSSGRCFEGKCAEEAVCGDLNISPPNETCDRENIGEATCASEGFDLGDLTCNSACQFDTSSCIKHEWVRVEAGTFTMGSPASEADRGANETAHEVTLTHAFEMMKTEVTQREFEIAGRYAPSAAHGVGVCADGACPVESLRWDEAVNYCNRLSQERGLEACYDCQSSGRTVFCALAAKYRGKAFYGCPGYRLPTEAEFEYAYRAGTKTPYQDASAAAIAWTQENSNDSPQPAAQKKANAWGLYDLAGNVSEWCQDWYVEDLGTAAVTDPAGPSSGEHRVTRGGSWHFSASRARAASRLLSKQDNRLYDVGFRCVRTVP